MRPGKLTLINDHVELLIIEGEVHDVHLQPGHLRPGLAVPLGHLLDARRAVVDVDDIRPASVVHDLGELGVATAEHQDARIFSDLDVLRELLEDGQEVVRLQEPVEVVLRALAVVSCVLAESAQRQSDTHAVYRCSLMLAQDV